MKVVIILLCAGVALSQDYSSSWSNYPPSYSSDYSDSHYSSSYYSTSWSWSSNSYSTSWSWSSNSYSTSWSWSSASYSSSWGSNSYSSHQQSGGWGSHGTSDDALKCYSCSSMSHQGCKPGQFDYGNMDMTVVCPWGHVCASMTTKIDDVEFVTRSCMPQDTPTDTDVAGYEISLCYTDFCNTGTTITIPIVLVMVAAMVGQIMFV